MNVNGPVPPKRTCYSHTLQNSQRHISLISLFYTADITIDQRQDRMLLVIIEMKLRYNLPFLLFLRSFIHSLLIPTLVSAERERLCVSDVIALLLSFRIARSRSTTATTVLKYYDVMLPDMTRVYCKHVKSAAAKLFCGVRDC